MAIAMGTSSEKELCFRTIKPFLMLTYVFDLSPECVELHVFLLVSDGF